MKLFFIAASALTLSACATTPTGGLDLCKGAALRRQAYTVAVTAADIYIASGRPVPASVELGRQAAVIALTALDARCPVGNL